MVDIILHRISYIIGGMLIYAGLAHLFTLSWILGIILIAFGVVGLVLIIRDDRKILELSKMSPIIKPEIIKSI